MYLELENICGFQSAKVQIDGITVIAGNNNTGKSTIGKSLLLMFNSLHNLEEKVDADKIYGIEDALDMLFRAERHRMDTAQFADYIYKNFDFTEKNGLLWDFLKENAGSFFDGKETETLQNIDADEIEGAVKQIVDTFHRDRYVYIKRFFSLSSQELFMGTIENNKIKDKASSISLIVKNKNIKCNFENEDIVKVENFEDFYAKAIFIDNPFVIDDLDPNKFFPRVGYFLGRRRYRDVKRLLLESLRVEEETNISIAELKEEGLQEVFNQLQSLQIGSLIPTKNGMKYKYNGDHELPILNISTGLKVFLIIKTLLLNGALQKNGTLILDEPEIHLHPEWQLVFAEILVLLQKTFGLHILLTTHSPYFLKAIETFAEKHAVQEKCHYYMTDCKDSYCTIEEVTENTKLIYKKFFDPFQALERIASNA